MEKTKNFTEGKIVQPLFLFAMPVLLALFLQAMYGAVDLLVVGKFGNAADISAVATGSQLMQSITNLTASFAMGTTILLGQKIGEGRAKEGGKIVGSSIVFFAGFAVFLTVLLVVLAPQLARVMNAPDAAMAKTKAYIRICGAGSLVIVAYNLIGCIFRGLGDSRTPLITVAIACAFNVGGDLLLVAGFHMGTEGAAYATVFAQLVSVVISYFLIRRQKLPFTMSRKDIFHPSGRAIGRVVTLGFPIALQDFLVSLSFLIILSIVNSLGLIYSAGVGVAEKVCAFIMLVATSFMQSMSAFVAQNYGAGKFDRATKALHAGIIMSLIMGIILGYLAYFHGAGLAGIFANDKAVIAQAADYLRAYAIDCIFTAILFCMIGFFNGIGYTKFVMIQGIVGAFAIRVPISYIMSKQVPVSLFHIGLATPASSIVQVLICLGCMAYVRHKEKKERELLAVKNNP